MNKLSLIQSAQLEFLSHRFTVTYGWKNSQERCYPHRYLESIVKIIKENNMKTIVEIGSIRYAYHSEDDLRHPCREDGQSLWYWAQTGARVFSVDINPHCVEVWASSGGEKYPNVTQHIMDGLEFLNQYSGESIDFLYLDGWDVGTGNYQQNHLEAYKNIKTKLSKNCMVAIDDDDFVTESKGELLYPILISDGFVNVAKGRVSVWVKQS